MQQRKTRILLDARKEVTLRVNTEETMYTYTPCHLDYAIQSHDIT